MQVIILLLVAVYIGAAITIVILVIDRLQWQRERVRIAELAVAFAMKEVFKATGRSRLTESDKLLGNLWVRQILEPKGVKRNGH